MAWRTATVCVFAVGASLTRLIVSETVATELVRNAGSPAKASSITLKVKESAPL